MSALWTPASSGEGARQLHVPPRRDEHVVAPADDGLHDEAALADRAVVEQRADEAVDRVAPEVLGDRQDSSVPLRRLDDRVAAADGQRQRLLAHRVQTEVEQGDGDAVVRGRVRRAVGGVQPVDLACHPRDVREDRGSGAEERLRLVGERLGLARIEIADRHEPRLLCSVRASSARPPRCRRPMPPHPTIAMLSKSATPLSSSVREAVNPKSELGRGCAHGRTRQAPARSKGSGVFPPAPRLRGDGVRRRASLLFRHQTRSSSALSSR